MALRIGIVGGGVSGLTAAYEAIRRGHRPEVFEAAPAVGVLASSFVFHGVADDRYYHFVCGEDHDLVELMTEIGAAGQIGWRPSRTLCFADGQLHPFNGALDLACFRPMPPFARLRFGLHALYCRYVRDWRRFDCLSAASWLKRHLGEAGYEAVRGPLLRAKFGAHAETISAPWIWHRIHRLGSSRRHPWSRERLGYCEGGSAPLIDGLLDRLAAASVPVHTSTRVDAVQIEHGRAVGLAVGGDKLAFDRVVAALPLPAAARLLPPGHELRAQLEGIAFLGIACVVLLLRRPLTDAFWVNVNDPEGAMAGFVEYSNLEPLPGLGGRALVYVPYYVPADSPTFRAADEELRDRALAGLERVVAGFRHQDAEDFRVFRDRRAQPICPPGFAAQVPPVVTSVEGLFVVDSTQLYPADRSRSGMIGIVRRHAAAMFGELPP